MITKDISLETGEIPREKWVEFFDDFSRQYEGRLVSVELIGADIGDQEEISRIPLMGISADLKHRENLIEIIAGDRPDTHVTHIISKPEHVRYKDPATAGGGALEIQSADGPTAILSFEQIGR